jgi:DNA-binding response OmpR family regulator
MQQRRYHILVVEADPVTLQQSVNALKKSDYVVAGASTADDATWWLSGWPVDLVIASARFEAATGVQLVLSARAAQPEISGMITGAVGDTAIRDEAERYGVHVATEPIASEGFVAEIATLMRGITRRQRWPRKAVSGPVSMRVGAAVGKLMDVSYGGLKFELQDDSAVLRSPVQLDFPRADLCLPAEVVWSTRGSGDRGAVFGASITAEPSRVADWRAFVDRLS